MFGFGLVSSFHYSYDGTFPPGNTIPCWGPTPHHLTVPASSWRRSPYRRRRRRSHPTVYLPTPPTILLPPPSPYNMDLWASVVAMMPPCPASPLHLLASRPQPGLCPVASWLILGGSSAVLKWTPAASRYHDSCTFALYLHSKVDIPPNVIPRPKFYQDWAAGNATEVSYDCSQDHIGTTFPTINTDSSIYKAFRASSVTSFPPCQIRTN